MIEARPCHLRICGTASDRSMSKSLPTESATTQAALISDRLDVLNACTRVLTRSACTTIPDDITAWQSPDQFANRKLTTQQSCLRLVLRPLRVRVSTAL